MNESKLKLSRRQALIGTIAVWSGSAIPLSRATTVAAEMGALSIAPLLGLIENLLPSALVGGDLLPLYPRDVAWSFAIYRAAHQVRILKRFQESVALDSTLPKKLTSYLRQESILTELTRALFMNQYGVQVNDWTFSDIEEPRNRWESRTQYMFMEKGIKILSSKIRKSSDIEPWLREEISKALSLPLEEDGCLDNVAVRKEGLSTLRFLLREVPECFPAKKIDLVKRLCLDLEINGRQTISIKYHDTTKSSLKQNEWHLHASALTHRWGLTDAQNVWGEPQRYIINQSRDHKPDIRSNIRAAYPIR